MVARKSIALSGAGGSRWSMTARLPATAANLQGEVDSAALYRALAEAEPDPHLSEVYRRLAAVEEAHAEFWRKQLARIGASRAESAAGLADAGAGLARAALRAAIRAADPEHARSSATAASTTASPRRSPAGCRRPSARTTASSRRWRRRCPAAPRAAAWRGSKGATAAAATRCAPRCSAPMTGWSPTSAW